MRFGSLRFGRQDQQVCAFGDVVRTGVPANQAMPVVEFAPVGGGGAGCCDVGVSGESAAGRGGAGSQQSVRVTWGGIGNGSRPVAIW